MKSFAIILNALFSLTIVAARSQRSQFDQNGINLDHLGVLVLLNNGMETKKGEFCTEPDDIDLIENDLNENVPDPDRRLRKRKKKRKRVHCERDCRGFTPGTCYLAYKKCRGYRYRELEAVEDSVDEEAEEDSVDDSKEETEGSKREEDSQRAEGRPDGTVERSLSRQARKLCNKLKRRAEERVNNNIKAKASRPCADLLSEPIRLICVEVFED